MENEFHDEIEEIELDRPVYQRRPLSNLSNQRNDLKSAVSSNSKSYLSQSVINEIRNKSDEEKRIR